MALTAALATTVAAACAAATLGVPPLLMVLFLLPGLGLVAVHPDRPGVPASVDSRRLLMALGIAVAVLYLSGVIASLDDLARMSWLLVVAVVPLSLMWPAPVIVRFCALLVAASLVGAAGSIGVVGWPLAGVIAGSAVALVAVHRSTRTGVPAAGATPADRGRQVGREAALLAVVAGLLALLVASLLSPPQGGGGPTPTGGQSARGRPGDLPPYLHPTDRLDAGGEGDGEGRQVVFRVTADLSSLWRTLTFDRYDGRTWRRSPELDPRRAEYQDGAVFVPPGVGEGEGSDVPLDQRFQVEVSSMGLVATAPVPFAVELAEGGAVVGEDGTIHASPFLGKGATYAVTSFLPPPAAVLAEDVDDDIPPDVRRFYLEVPAVPARVGELADRLTAGVRTPYGKVLAVRDWMAANTEFRRGTDALAPGQDPVDRFLFEDGGGSSQQAASAMAVLLRSAGVPTRMAAGYLPGDRAVFGGELVVRARHAATWVEVWFPSAGWVPFDPTLRFLAPEPVDDSLLSRLGRLLRALWWVAVLVGLALATWLAVWLARRRRALRSRPWATRCYERLGRAGARYGRPRRPPETPAEYCAALAAIVPEDRLARVGDLLTVAAYSTREPPAEDRRWADAVVADLWRRAPRRRRGRGRDTPPPAPVPAGGSAQAPG